MYNKEDILYHGEQKDMTEEHLELDQHYQAGYRDMMWLHQEAIRRGWPMPPERRLVMEIMWLERSASMSRSQSTSLPILNHPLYPSAWYRGRAEAIKMILRETHSKQD
jgi:hypothetical protein